MKRAQKSPPSPPPIVRAAMQSHDFVYNAAAQLARIHPHGKVSLIWLGHHLKQLDPNFTPKQYGHANLVKLLKSHELLNLYQEAGGHWAITLAQEPEQSNPSETDEQQSLYPCI